MSVYEIGEDQSLLLVGEGRFSFSVELFKHLASKGRRSFGNVYATCFEPEPATPRMLANIDTLKSSGFKVILGVDATKLSEHPVLRELRFDKIVFNFPHVGGKMKIHLNRRLLADFFASCAPLLKEGAGSEVIVALCQGQGGTPAEVVERRWDDTWKLVEMSAHGHLTLSSVEPFPSWLFPDYVSVGFRGGEKSFCTKNALVHKLVPSPELLLSTSPADLEYLLSMREVPDLNNFRCYPVHLKGITEDPFRRETSAQAFLVRELIRFLSEETNCTVNSETGLPLYFEGDPTTHAVCCVDGLEKTLRSSLSDVLERPGNASCYNVFTGVVFGKPERFSSPSLGCQVAVTGNRSILLCRDFVRRCYELWGNKGECKDSFMSYSDNMGGVETCVMDFDGVCVGVFGLDSSRQLWTPAGVSVRSGEISLSSRYPPSFTFDVCFAADRDFTEDRFFSLLKHLAEAVIESVSLLNIYEPPGDTRKCYCYRIVYKSYVFALHRKRVVEYHQNVLGKALTHVLGVVVS